MPRTSSVYTRNQKLIDKLRAEGNSWREVHAKLRKAGVKKSLNAIHKAYRNYHRRAERRQRDEIPLPGNAPDLERFVKINHPEVWKAWTKHDKAREKQQEQLPHPKRIQYHVAAALQVGEFDSQSAEIVQERCDMLAKYSNALASIHLYHCLVLQQKNWLPDFEHMLEVASEITQRMQGLID